MTLTMSYLGLCREVLLYRKQTNLFLKGHEGPSRECNLLSFVTSVVSNFN